MAILSLHEIELSHGGPNLFDAVSLTVEPGDRLCLVGRNGVGKSTLLRVIAGSETPDRGTVSLAGSLTPAHLPQEPPEGLGGTAIEAAMEIALSGTAIATTDDTAMAEQIRQDHRVNVSRYLSRLNVVEAHPVEQMSGGEIRRTLLAGVLARDADILLLDEPTNHLDIDAILWLEEHLLDRRNAGVAIVFVTHDRSFARRVANRIAEIDRGAVYTFSEGYDDFVRRREAQLQNEERERAEFDRKLANEEAWLRKGTRARRTRDEGRVRALEAMRQAYAERRERIGSAGISIAEANRSGDLIAELEEVSFSWPGATQPLIQDLTTTIYRGDRIGIIGPNGAGKTTLLRLLVGPLAGPLTGPATDWSMDPLEYTGSIRRGSKLKVIYFDQLREQLAPEQTIHTALGDGYETISVNGVRRNVTAYMKEFLFSEHDVNRPVHTLSGGERNRLLLARLLAQPSNVIVLDEPTNDLDAETLDLLEDRLSAYAGTVILVSHDRSFLDNIVMACLVIAPGGRVEESPGGYTDWELRRRTAARPVQTGQSGVPDSSIATARGKKTAREDPPQKPTDRRRKLGFNERRELEELPDRIAALEATVQSLHDRLADPDLYRTGESSGETPAVLTGQLTETEEAIAAAMSRWEELEEIAAGE